MITQLHVKSGDDSLNSIAVIGWTICVENWPWQPSCFSEIAEINTSQAYATLYPYAKFSDDIVITFPLIDRKSSKCWVSRICKFRQGAHFVSI